MQRVHQLVLAAACWLVAFPIHGDTLPTARTNSPSDKPSAPAAVSANPVHTGPGRQRIYAKLDAIRLDSVAYDGIPLSEVIKALDEAALKRDPEKKGINFLLSSTADPFPVPAPAIDPQTGLPFPPVPSRENELESANIRISPPQRDITLHQMLDILVLVADRPIKYSVTDFGVLITEDTTPLYTRWYQVDPNTFFNGLKGLISQQFGSAYANGAVQTAAFTVVPAVRKPGPGSRTPYPQTPGTIVGIDPAETQASPEARFARIKSDFSLLGVDLTQPPKSVVYKDQLGMLMIRGTLADLENVAQLIKRCQSRPGIEGTISTPVNSATPRIPQSQK